MIGHAAANQIPIVASNRVGIENEKDITIKFYGNSLIIDHVGDVVSQMNEEEEGLRSHDFNIEEIRNYRQSWGNFRDRRPDLYKKICDFWKKVDYYCLLTIKGEVLWKNYILFWLA